MTTAVIVAIITGVFSVLVALIQKTRKENKEDHNLVYDSIKTLRQDVRGINDKLDKHINWHLVDK